MKNKPAKNKPVEIELYFRPKKGTEAEYTFYPTDEFKAENECDADDVGFFLRDTEVLYLVTKNQTKTTDGKKIIDLEEGRVEIHPELWEELSKPVIETLIKKNKIEIHDISNIKQEYLSDL